MKLLTTFLWILFSQRIGQRFKDPKDGNETDSPQKTIGLGFHYIHDTLSVGKTLSILAVNTLLRFDPFAPKTLPTSVSVPTKTFSYLSDSVSESIFPVQSPLFRPAVRVLDFACGSGSISTSLLPYLDPNGEIVGLDISKRKLESFDAKATFLNTFREEDCKTNSHIQAFLYDVLDSEFNEFQETRQAVESMLGSFDVVVSSFSLNNFLLDYEEVVKKLEKFLKPGGWLLMLDVTDDEDDDVGMEDIKTGLTNNDMIRAFEKAGLTKVDSKREFAFRLPLKKFTKRRNILCRSEFNFNQVSVHVAQEITQIHVSLSAGQKAG